MKFDAVYDLQIKRNDKRTSFVHSFNHSITERLVQIHGHRTLKFFNTRYDLDKEYDFHKQNCAGIGTITSEIYNLTISRHRKYLY